MSFRSIRSLLVAGGLFLLIGAIGLLPSGVHSENAKPSFGFQGERPFAPEDHLNHPLEGREGMEQWSGTITFAPEHRVNFNLINSNLQTGSKKGTFRVEFLEPGKEKVSEEFDCKIKVSKEPPALVCEDAALIGTPDNLKVQFTGKKIKLVATIQSLVPPFRPGDGRLVKEKGEFYDFVLMIPRGAAAVTINGQTLAGFATVDHSYSTVGLHEIARHWARTTFTRSDLSVTFAVAVTKKGETTGWVSVVNAEGKAYLNHQLDIAWADPLPDPDKKGYEAPRRIELKGRGDGFSLTLKEMTLRYKRDMLKDLNPVVAFFVRKVSDPMVYAMEGTCEIVWPEANPPIAPFVMGTQVKQLNK